MPDSVANLYQNHRDNTSRLSVDELTSVLQSVVAAKERVFIVVDALDECASSGNCQQLFITNLLGLQPKSGVNLFLTSRPIPSIKERFEENTILEIRAHEGDVQKYLEDHMSSLPGFVRRDPYLQQEIKARIVKCVDGENFLSNPLQVVLLSYLGFYSLTSISTR